MHDRHPPRDRDARGRRRAVAGREVPIDSLSGTSWLAHMAETCKTTKLWISTSWIQKGDRKNGSYVYTVSRAGHRRIVVSSSDKRLAVNFGQGILSSHDASTSSTDSTGGTHGLLGGRHGGHDSRSNRGIPAGRSGGRDGLFF